MSPISEGICLVQDADRTTKTVVIERDERSTEHVSRARVTFETTPNYIDEIFDATKPQTDEERGKKLPVTEESKRNQFGHPKKQPYEKQ